MNWNHDISAAPLTGYVWLYTKCGKVTKSYWLSPDLCRWLTVGRWCMLSENEKPVAWREYDKDEFPPIKINGKLTWPKPEYQQ